MSTHAEAVGTRAHEVRCLNLADGTFSLPLPASLSLPLAASLSASLCLSLRLSLSPCLSLCLSVSLSGARRADTVTTVQALAQGKMLLLGESLPRTEAAAALCSPSLSACACVRLARSPATHRGTPRGQAGSGWWRSRLLASVRSASAHADRDRQKAEGRARQRERERARENMRPVALADSSGAQTSGRPSARAVRWRS